MKTVPMKKPMKKPTKAMLRADRSLFAPAGGVGASAPTSGGTTGTAPKVRKDATVQSKKPASLKLDSSILLCKAPPKKKQKKRSKK